MSKIRKVIKLNYGALAYLEEKISWEFRSKSRQDICFLEGGCRGYMFASKVFEELESGMMFVELMSMVCKEGFLVQSVASQKGQLIRLIHGEFS
uniref:Uncharacterized protein n=1 Tax=Nelumbo nucifera TaxID=4432 RepID=A0A822Z489_NELNU|nr:TPA_asm: hypothetical protein HUJ06_013676 [Nelumbo nucifera]